MFHQLGRRTRALWTPRARGIALLVAVAAGALWSGCTVTKQNYKTLSFFFDGVPDPSLPAGSIGGVDGGKPVFVIVHKPYALEKCDECHKSKYRPSRNDSSICLQCHEAVKAEHARMHGAVVANACLWCHNPHESGHPHLLRDNDRKVCSQCHTPSMLNATRVPEHADATRACLECHSGHGGAAAFFLKPEAKNPPAPAETSTPPSPPPGEAPEKK